MSAAPGTSLRCPVCATENPSGFHFCGACGSALEVVVCAGCGVSVAAGQRFCGVCGRAVALELPMERAAPAAASPAPEPRRERKLATVLFADIVGFTGYAEHADPETVATTVAAAMERLGGIVAEHGGTIDKYLGDALMAVFGVPVAHDDDAERAVAAALAMRDQGDDLQLRIGVNSGDVLATTMPGDDHVTVIGDTVNVADRLAKAGAPGEVLVGPLTAELCAHRIRLRARDAVLVKGRTDAVHHFEALGLESDDHAGAGEGAGQPTLVGREDELAFLCARWQRCVTQRRALPLVLVGEVGAGKSRLLSELAARVGPEARVVRVTYPAYGSLAGSRIVGAVLDQLGGPLGEPRVDARLAALAGEDTGDPTGSDPATVEAEQLRAMRRLIETRAADRPILVAIDEAQRLSETTHRFLAELIARVDGPVLLVLAGRPEPADWLLRHPLTERIRVDPLDPQAARRLVTMLLPDVPLAAETIELLARRGAGNPLHLRELVRLVADRQGLVDEGGGGGLRLRGDLRLPPSLQAVLAARLDALDPAHKAVLQHVAVMEGVGATATTLSTLGLPAPSTGLRALVTAGVLRQLEVGGHEFADPLLRDVAYESLPRRQRGALHRQAAGISDRVDDRVRHLEAALAVTPEASGLGAETAEAVGDAGLALIRRSRPRDAVGLLQRAVNLGDRRPRVLLELANQQSDRLAGDREVVAVLALLPEGDDAAVEAERVHILANSLARSDPAEAVARYGEARRRWGAAGRPDKEAWALSNCGIALVLLGRFTAAEAALAEAAAIFERIGDRQGLSVTRQTIGLVRPDDPRVEGWMNEGLSWAQETGDRSRERYARQGLTFFHFLRSCGGGPQDTEAALGHALALAEVGAELGDAGAAVQGHALAAIILRLAGDLDRAGSEARAAVDVEPDGSIGSDALCRTVRDLAALVRDPGACIEAPQPTRHDSIGHIAGTATALGAALAGQMELALDCGCEPGRQGRRRRPGGAGADLRRRPDHGGAAGRGGQPAGGHAGYSRGAAGRSRRGGRRGTACRGGGAAWGRGWRPGAAGEHRRRLARGRGGAADAAAGGPAGRRGRAGAARGGGGAPAGSRGAARSVGIPPRHQQPDLLHFARMIPDGVALPCGWRTLLCTEPMHPHRQGSLP